jgi:hypothetical protein
MQDTIATRQATRSKLGPWYVLQQRNPSAPGMNFATLLSLIDRNRVTPRSVLRGPTTQQMWTHAARVKGVSREFGVCWHCSGEITKTTRLCPHCKRFQEPPPNPDALLEGADTPLRSASASSSAAASASSVGQLRKGGAGPSTSAGQRSAARDSSDGVFHGEELAAYKLPANYGVGARPRGSVFKGVCVSMLLALIAFGTVLYLNPPLRQHYWEWASHLADSSFFHGPQGRADGTAPSTAARSDAASTPLMSVAHSSSGATPVGAAPTSASGVKPSPGAPSVNLLPRSDVQVSPAIPRPVAPDTVTPPTIPSNRDAGSSKTPGASGDAIPRNTAPASSGPANASSPDPSTGDIQISAPQEMDLATAQQRGMDLLQDGVTLEQKGDYVNAIKTYESIKKLPAAAWPMGLEINLQRAHRGLNYSIKQANSQ